MEKCENNVSKMHSRDRLVVCMHPIRPAQPPPTHTTEFHRFAATLMWNCACKCYLIEKSQASKSKIISVVPASIRATMAHWNKTCVCTQAHRDSKNCRCGMHLVAFQSTASDETPETRFSRVLGICCGLDSHTHTHTHSS